MKDNDKSTLGLEMKQLANLFSVGLESLGADPPGGAEPTLSSRIDHYLDQSLGDDQALLDVVQIALEPQGYPWDSLTPRTVRAALQDPDIPLGLLQAVKTHFKKMQHTTVCHTEKAFAVTLYHTALACAFVYHHQNISQSSAAVLWQSFTTLAQKEWITPELEDLFYLAGNICENNMATD